MSNKIITVLGATGNQGGSVVRALLTQGGYHVRAVTRDAGKKAALDLLDLDKQLRGGSGESRVELVEAQLDDEASLKRAFEGAYGVFGVTNYWEGADLMKEFHQGVHIAHAAKATHVKHLVWSSLEFSYVPHFVSKAMVESYIQHLGVPYTAIHFPAYYENHLGFPTMTPRRQADGTFVLSMPIDPDQARLPLFSVADSGAFVVEALNYPDLYLGKQMRVASESLTARQMAATFERVTGVATRAEEVDHEAFQRSFPGAEELYLNLKWFADNPTARDVAWSRRVHPQIKDWAGFVHDHLDFYKNLTAQ
ncbi:NmrAlike family protein [Acanthamoeba castellanii str. Neff]|uniref:NmrAlike family protein n=1 Tax=Acanthamoeba castellanii (strain ATCC 30010 / Neff) TaxID=1257118 RepID=L8HHI2_ACACF|nr:NmrAlike family protein [Acanthamoeba castellanii str. Neff]ELR24657.1 NmrAlike family protein [Acanthamoeba castellanii str. Neff]